MLVTHLRESGFHKMSETEAIEAASTAEFEMWQESGTRLVEDNFMFERKHKLTKAQFMAESVGSSTTHSTGGPSVGYPVPNSGPPVAAPVTETPDELLSSKKSRRAITVECLQLAYKLTASLEELDKCDANNVD